MTSLHVDSGREWRGGQAQVLHLVRGLNGGGDRAILVAPKSSPLYQRATAAGLVVHALPLLGEWDLLTIAGLVALLIRYRPSVAHAHTAHAVTLLGVASRIARVPLVVAARRVDFPVSSAGRLKLTRLADVVICVSAAIRDVLRSCGVDEGRLEVIHSGIAPRPARPGSRERLRGEFGVGDASLIGAVGALVAHKDHQTLVEAAGIVLAQRPTVRFVIAGSGPLEDRLRALARERGTASSVDFVGFRNDIPDLLAALDIFVLSSCLEGLGTSVLEAMAAGVAVIATRAGGAPEMVEQERSGLLVPTGDPDRLAAAIVRLIDDPALRRSLAATALEVVTDRFLVGTTVERTADLYRRRLARSRV